MQSSPRATPRVLALAGVDRKSRRITRLRLTIPTADLTLGATRFRPAGFIRTDPVLALARSLVAVRMKPYSVGVSTGKRTLAKDVEFVRVFATEELGRYVFARSLLDREEIEYIDKGEALKNVTGWTPSGWLDTVNGPAELWVRSEDAARARSLLRALDEGTPDAGDDSNSDA